MGAPLALPSTPGGADGRRLRHRCQPVSWTSFGDSALLQAGYAVTFGALAYGRFVTKDVLSRLTSSPGARAAPSGEDRSWHAPDMSSTLARRVYDTCHLTGAFRLRSGQSSAEYFDKYLFEADPRLLGDVARAMVELLPECDVLAGMELGGVPIAAVMSQLTGLPTIFVRKAAKEYGTCKMAEGPSVQGRRVVVIEDVVTTGGALLASCAALRSEGALVETVVCAIDRLQGGAGNLLAENLTLRAALTRTDLEAHIGRETPVGR